MLRRAGAAAAASALLAFVVPLTGPVVAAAAPLQLPVPAPQAPWVAVGRLDGDGREDVVRVGPGGTGATVSFGRADGGTDDVGVDSGGADAVVALDVDDDGTDELLWWARSGTSANAQLWRRTGSGRTWRSQEVSAPPPGTRAHVVDIDGDGRDDVLWHGPVGIDALDRSRGGSGFERERFGALGQLQPQVGDFDGDDVGDVLWYDPAGGDGAMWWGGDQISAAPFNIGTGMVLHPGQWDGDGALDLLVGGENGNVQLDGHESRRFTAEPVPPAVVAEAVVGDFNGDKRSDLVELDARGGGPGGWNNDSSGWLWEPWPSPAVPIGTLADGAWNVVAADLDGDGTDELLSVPATGVDQTASSARIWVPGYRREAIYREGNPHAIGGLVIRMLGITGGRRVDPPLSMVHDACGAEWPVHSAIADRVQAMLSDAASINLGICINSSHRSYSDQVSIRSRICAQFGFAANRGCIYEWRSGHWPFVGGNQVARPGYSRHQLGIAIDVGDLEGYATAPVTSWLSANAHRYGLYNLGDRRRLGPGFVWGEGGEPWHLSIDGR